MCAGVTGHWASGTCLSLALEFYANAIMLLNKQTNTPKLTNKKPWIQGVKLRSSIMKQTKPSLQTLIRCLITTPDVNILGIRSCLFSTWLCFLIADLFYYFIIVFHPLNMPLIYHSLIWPLPTAFQYSTVNLLWCGIYFPHVSFAYGFVLFFFFLRLLRLWVYSC